MLCRGGVIGGVGFKQVGPGRQSSEVTSALRPQSRPAVCSGRGRGIWGPGQSSPQLAV